MALQRAVRLDKHTLVSKMFTKLGLTDSIFKICVMVFGTGIFQLAFAQNNYPVPVSPEVEKKPWVEQEATLPAYPKDENLISFKVSAMTTNKFFIDSQSIVIGDDGVVRYTLVVVSSTNAKNVSNEGIRCDSKEWRAYAFGRKDGTWENAKQSLWKTIVPETANRHHIELYKRYFCHEGLIVKKPQQAITALKQGVSNSQFAE